MFTKLFTSTEKGKVTFNDLPIEIQDRIFLYLDLETLRNTRELQSEYVIGKTKYTRYSEAIEDNNFYILSELKKTGRIDKEILRRELEPGSDFEWIMMHSANYTFCNKHYDCNTNTNSVTFHEDSYLLLTLAIQSKNIEIVDWVLGNYKIPKYYYVCCLIPAVLGNLEILKKLLDNQFYIGNLENLFECCARTSNIEIATWLREEKQFGITQKLLEQATCWSKLSFMKWCVENGLRLTERVFKIAAGTGDFEILKWLNKESCPMDSSVSLEAVSSCNLDVLKWLHLINCPIESNSFSEAVRRNDLKIIDFLTSINTPISKNILDDAFMACNEEIIQNLLDKGYNKLTGNAIKNASLTGNTDHIDRILCLSSKFNIQFKSSDIVITGNIKHNMRVYLEAIKRDFMIMENSIGSTKFVNDPDTIGNYLSTGYTNDNLYAFGNNFSDFQAYTNPNLNDIYIPPELNEVEQVLMEGVFPGNEPGGLLEIIEIIEMPIET